MVEAVPAERVQAREGLGLREVLEANGALQLFVQDLKNVGRSGHLFSHGR